MDITPTKGVLSVNRVVAFFDAVLDGSIIPIPSMKISVIENSADDYVAFTNLRRIDRGYGTPEGVAGMGASIDAAVSDLLREFFRDLEHNRPTDGYTERDFGWADPETF